MVKVAGAVPALHEAYADQEALKTHSSTPYFLEFFGKMKDFAAGPPKIEMLHGAH